MSDARDFIAICHSTDIETTTKQILSGLSDILHPSIYESSNSIIYGWNVRVYLSIPFIIVLIYLKRTDNKDLKLPTKIIYNKVKDKCYIKDFYSTKHNILNYMWNKSVKLGESIKWIRLVSGEWVDILCNSKNI